MRNKYTLEFKKEAVKLVTEQGYTRTRAAKELRISEKNIDRWIKLSVDADKKPATKVQTSDSQDEIKRLRKENERLKMERDILKKATVFFAKENC
jgi:transposase